MLRECNFNDISDRHTYGLNDMVRLDTDGCSGCHKCCTGMGQSIILDPFDIWRMKTCAYETRVSFETLIQTGKIELNLVDGLILPNLRMNENDACSFLNENGRCSIHAARPSVCRLFPLGRVYDENGFSYFLQKDECAKEVRAKMKVKKWIDTDNIREQEIFVLAWHNFIRMTGSRMIALRERGTSEIMNEIAIYVLNTFYVKDVEVSEDAKAYRNLVEMIREATKKIEIL
ncbi:MAG: YkgJ family cysteine cluster protein [Eubacteriales bacterium]|nr:YkgJ family cysteine cluster protein [Eubacteriales bacterium]